MSISKIRKSIDHIDGDMLKLLNERAKLVFEIAKIKSKDKLSTFSAEREVTLLKRLKKLNKGPLKSKDIELIFTEILSLSRALQLLLNVAYLGPKGTFTHLASAKKFGKSVNFVPCNSIGEVFHAVEKEDLDYGVVPIENSIEGVVNYTLDMFFESNLKICSEVLLKISHSLLRADPKKKLLRIYSHPQVFPQCRTWLLRHYPNAKLIPTAATAKAAEMVKKDPASACIGNSILARLYDLKEINSNIQDSSSNVTRFLVVSNKDSLASGEDKTSVLFSIKDKVGALHDILNSFKRHSINLTKIESRPSKKKPWEYYFFVDFSGHRSDEGVKKVLKNLEKNCVFLKVLGSYPKES